MILCISKNNSKSVIKSLIEDNKTQRKGYINFEKHRKMLNYNTFINESSKEIVKSV